MHLSLVLTRLCFVGLETTTYSGIGLNPCLTHECHFSYDVPFQQWTSYYVLDTVTCDGLPRAESGRDVLFLV